MMRLNGLHFLNTSSVNKFGFFLSDPNPPLDITAENKNIISTEAVRSAMFTFRY